MTISKQRIRKLAEQLGFKYRHGGNISPPNDFKSIGLPPRGYHLELTWDLLCAFYITARFHEIPLFKGDMVRAFLLIEELVFEETKEGE